MEAMSIDNAINNYMNTARVYLKFTSDRNAAELNTYIGNTLQQETQVTINLKREDSETYSNGFNTNYFNYLGYILISTLITGVSLVMFSFHGLDLRRRHSAAPLSSRSMNVQLILANLIFVLGLLLLFIIAGYVLNKDRMINQNTLLIWVNALVFTITALSISYLIGIVVKSKRAVSAIATTLSLCFAFLSGIFVPQDYLGSAITKVASFMPTFWYVKANNTIGELTSFAWSDISGVFGYIAIQLGFAAAFFCIALVVSKRKRQQVS
jgi:ABC-2 type transport system permease protein